MLGYVHVITDPKKIGEINMSNKIYFLHIPKTGGTTINSFLYSIYPNTSFLLPDRNTSVSDFVCHKEKYHSNWKIVTGHFFWYAHEILKNPLECFTVVREPFARAFSHWRHVHRSSEHYLHKTAVDLQSFHAYLTHPETQPTVVNFQLRCIGANIDPIEIAKTLTDTELTELRLEQKIDTDVLRESPDELYRNAIDRLQQMSEFGLTEHIEESLQRFCDIFKWPKGIGLAHLNADPLKLNPMDHTSSETRRLFNTLNAAEIEFYEHAKARFLKR